MIDSTIDLQSLVREASSAEAGGDWQFALERWGNICSQYPDASQGYTGSALALQQLSRFDEADVLLRDALPAFPNDPAVAVAYAFAAQQRQQWPEALLRWERANEAFPGNAEATVGIATSLQRLTRTDAAEAFLERALQQGVQALPVLIEYAQIVHRQRLWPEALRRWHAAVDRFPQSIDAVLGVTTALHRLERYDELDCFLRAAIPRFPNDPEPAMEFARAAHHRQCWPEALERWKAARALFPTNESIAEGIREVLFQVQLETLGGHDIALAQYTCAVDAVSSTIASEKRDLMMRFESLGSGCELGLVQRRFGAEPLGLLRWGSISLPALVHALEARFAGIASPKHAKIFEWQDSKEFFFVDTQYSLEMHTFIAADSSQLDRVFTQQCRRVRRLACKLLDDLECADAPSKIFVYNHRGSVISDHEALTLHAAIRRYGTHVLLCVRPESHSYPNGTVRAEADGLLIGYLDYLSPTAHAPDIRYESWMALCSTAYCLSRRNIVSSPP